MLNQQKKICVNCLGYAIYIKFNTQIFQMCNAYVTPLRRQFFHPVYLEFL